MDPMWDDEQIKKALKGRVPEGPREAVSDRAWASIEKAVRVGNRRGSDGSVTGPSWTDGDVSRALKGRVPAEPGEEVSRRAWASIERAVREGSRSRTVGLSWGLWGGTLRYAAAVLLLLAGIGSFLEARDYRREGRIASYLETLTEGVEEAEEVGPVWVSAFLTESLDEDPAGSLVTEDDDEPGIEEEGAWL